MTIGVKANFAAAQYDINVACYFKYTRDDK